MSGEYATPSSDTYDGNPYTGACVAADPFSRSLDRDAHLLISQQHLLLLPSLDVIWKEIVFLHHLLSASDWLLHYLPQKAASIQEGMPDCEELSTLLSQMSLCLERVKNESMSQAQHTPLTFG